MSQISGINNLNSAFQQYFRASKRVRIHNRKGSFLVVDDREEAIDLVRKLLTTKQENNDLLSASNVSEAQRIIEKQDAGALIKAVVIDLGLSGVGNDSDGVILAKWLKDNYPDVPFIFSTGREKKAKQLEKDFPGVDIFIKGKHNLKDFEQALGLNAKEEKENEVIPKDKVIKEDKKEPKFYSFLKAFISS